MALAKVKQKNKLHDFLTTVESLNGNQRLCTNLMFVL